MFRLAKHPGICFLSPALRVAEEDCKPRPFLFYRRWELEAQFAGLLPSPGKALGLIPAPYQPGVMVTLVMPKEGGGRRIASSGLSSANYRMVKDSPDYMTTCFKVKSTRQGDVC